eukprot:6181226-Pleurochrysis_carterae.AAC.1
MSWLSTRSPAHTRARKTQNRLDSHARARLHGRRGEAGRQVCVLGETRAFYQQGHKADSARATRAIEVARWRGSVESHPP